ncbi:MAG: MlaD family protein [Muribaculaceae bacterium]
MKKLFKKEFLIGACILLALVILYFGIEFLKGASIFQPSNYYYATYENVGGLSVSAPVTVNGYKVGQVRSIEYLYDNPGHVRVEMALDSRLQLPEGSAAIFTTDMLGTSSIAIELGKGTQYCKVGSELPSSAAKGLMDTATADVIPSVLALMAKVDTLISTTNALMGDPAIAATIKRLDAISANMVTTTQSLNRAMASTPAIMKDVKVITGNFNETSAELNRFTQTLNRVPLDSLTQQLQLTIDNINSLTRDLNNPDSTLGKLLHDPELYNNLSNTAASMDALLQDIKKNPKRYISIKLL